MPQPGWYDDPDAPGQQRYWDGARWAPASPPVAPAQPVGLPPAPSGAPSSTNLAMWCHLAPLVVGGVGIVMSLGTLFVLAWIPPLLIMNSQGARDPFVREHAVESLNFQLSWLIYTLVATIPLTILTFITLGIGLLLLVPVALGLVIWAIIVMIQATMAASSGRSYHYATAMRLVS